MGTTTHIALMLYPHVLATSLTLPIEMLKAGEAHARRHHPELPKLQISLLGIDNTPVESRAGLMLAPTNTIDELKQADFVIVPSIWRNPRPILKRYQAFCDWLAHSWQQGGTIIGVGTGTVFLAESGILDGHAATTHWHYAVQFQRNYPLVKLKPEFFITQSERIYCAASLNSLADIVVHLISQLYGIDAAQHVERNFSHEIRKSYQEQRYLEGAVDRHPDELIAQIQFWLKNNLANDVNFTEVADQFGISHRTLSRRFKDATGTTAALYLQQLRFEAAKELLGSTNLTIQEIAVAVGYSDQGHLTRLFKRFLSQTPSDYRLLVRKKLFTTS